MDSIIVRKILVCEIANIINNIKLPHPIRVAIDGPGNAGKTTFANEIAEQLKLLNRNVIRSTIDGFHNPPEFRRRQGQFSPKGYLEDSHNYPSIIKYLLEPLGPNGTLEYKESIYDFKVSQPTNSKLKRASKNSILIFDGIFLFKEELINYWDYKIYIDASFDITTQRAIERDSELFGGEDKVIELYKKRYIPGHGMYLSLYEPIQVSDITLNNNNYQKPTIIKLSENKYHKKMFQIINS